MSILCGALQKLHSGLAYSARVFLRCSIYLLRTTQDPTRGTMSQFDQIPVQSFDAARIEAQARALRAAHLRALLAYAFSAVAARLRGLPALDQSR